MRTSTRTPALVAVLLCAVTLVLGYLNKARCAGPLFDELGRTVRFESVKDADVCYSDIQQLWIGRDINLHRFPFLDGNITAAGHLVGGTVEYPVLSGVLMWLGAVPAHNDAEFLFWSALLLAPFGLLTAWLLGRLAGWAALLWSVTPPLVLYAFLNWDLPVVATTVGAIAIVATRRWSLRTRGVIAAVLLGIGFCLKLYPGIFLLTLVAYILTRGDHTDRDTTDRDATATRFDVKGAVAVAAAGAATVVAVNLPFALLGYTGWRASFEFQSNRAADSTSNSIWFWGLRPLLGGYEGTDVTPAYNGLVALLSPLLICGSFAVALVIGWRRYRREGTYPWIAIGGAMLCGFLLLHKVHSPQYTLWLLPLLVLVRIRWSLVAAYLVADVAIGIGVFLWFAATGGQRDMTTALLLTQAGVWGRAILLVVLFVVFARAPLRMRAPAPSPERPSPMTTTGRVR
ncbi:glycosyltransferase 87 family protein [Rhodococcus zopfii]|uniref:glycosyltransferase 87 family protein n=1 Tax=Rhodococcus zopfii TaxID=43772 RepID=UPI001486918F|nr:glycosyltransferase 87 family protein [Rhodococcus zopfii]